MLAVTAGVPYRLGGMVVTLPAAAGHYTLDVLNLANTNDLSSGMVQDFGFGQGAGDPVTKWASAAGGDDVIAYANGPLTLTVVPEPSTALLLASALVAMAAGRRRRAL